MAQSVRFRLRYLLLAAGVACAGLAHGAAPVANDDAYSTSYNETLIVSAPGVLANDTDADMADTLSVSQVVAQPLNGTLDMNANGGFTYNPDNTFDGVDSFSYEVTDGSEVDQAVVQVTVAAYGGGGGGGGGGGYGSGGAPSSALLLLFATAALYRGLKLSKRRAISP